MKDWLIIGGLGAAGSLLVVVSVMAALEGTFGGFGLSLVMALCCFAAIGRIRGRR